MLILTAKRILVIDDAEDIREVAQVSLEVVGGWEVLTASSGQEGVAKALAEQPDAILLDVMMPDQDGPTTFLQLQANNATQHIPVILLTAKALASDRRMFADLGVVSVIAKPFEPMSLAAQVAQALGWEQGR
ncbi:response regulator [Microcoleus sp. herbarium19]|uniref:response regulator n=1 Tax=unclassified Microcoleus TaxID=2642155 RepID=UPI002FD54B68